MSLSRRTFVSGAAALGLSAPLLGCRHEPASKASGRKKVRLTYGIVSVPKTRGVFERTLREQGIDVEWIGPFPNHAPTLQAVATNSADFSFGGSSTPAIQAILSGAKLSFVSWATSAPRTTSIIVLPSSGIASVSDLVGKTVAVNKAGVAEFLLVAALDKYRIPREKVQVVYMNPPDAAPAFAAGKIDAWAIWQGPLDLAEVQYGAKRIFQDDKELDREFDFGTYLVREDYAKQEAETVRNVITAYQTEVAWANANRAEAVALSYKISKYPQAVIDKIAAQDIKSTLSFIDDAGIEKLQYAADWMSQHQVSSGRLEIAKHVARV